MQRLITIMLVSIVMICQSSTAGTITFINTRSDCDNALDKADEVMTKQGDLIILLKSKLDQEQTQNEALQEAVIRLQHVSDTAIQRNLIWGMGGVVAGVILLSVVRK